MLMAPLIAIKNLSKSFATQAGNVDVLHDINLAIEDGESIAIVGPSGSGKSTLLSIIGLLETFQAGSFQLRDHAVDELTDRQKRIIRNQHIGWIFQNFNLLPDLTAWENVALPLKFNQSINRQHYFSLALEALERVGLKDKAKSFPTQLSGGQQQRVAIARALVTKPGLLLADEPTGNLDSESSKTIVDLLTQLAQEGSAVIVVTHDDSVARRCSRRLTLNSGRLVDEN